MPELKLYSDEHDLSPFDEQWTREQLERLAKDFGVLPAAAGEVRAAGAGFPLNNVVLARHLEGTPPAWRDKGAALRECAERMLAGVAEELRDYFRALCVLRSFDEDRMPTLLAVWFDGTVTEWDYQRCRRIREDMVATRLVRWQGGEGFVMDEAVRDLLRNALREDQPARWVALHRAAKRMYDEWKDKYPAASERWGPEARYHAGRLGGEAEHGASRHTG